ncbi:hypothetical protein ACA910_008513 [Epithemia clementina (nom. ined.)]
MLVGQLKKRGHDLRRRPFLLLVLSLFILALLLELQGKLKPIPSAAIHVAATPSSSSSRLPTSTTTSGTTISGSDLLEAGDMALSEGILEQAIEYYEQGIALVVRNNGDTHSTMLETLLSLYTNLATAYSSISDEDGSSKNYLNYQRKAIENYENAVQLYRRTFVDLEDGNSNSKQALDNNNNIMERKEVCTQIVAQASFFLGMVHQDLHQVTPAVNAYRYAHELDPLHWSSWANLGSILHDELNNHREALQAYNQAYLLLTSPNNDVTDPPEDLNHVLSQLQYRIGLCITHDPNKTCAVPKGLRQVANSREAASATTENIEVVDCNEMATHAFALAVQYDPDHENAKHMLATITADASMKRASNQYVQNLFDDYAVNFEHSLVDELHYTGFERLRRGFDRALMKVFHTTTADASTTISRTASAKSFAKVLDAGCGTGLVGEQFRNISDILIGVDLSSAILREAEKARPNLYNQLLAGDLIDVLEGEEHRNSIDLIVAADSYIYFGDLDPLFAAMYKGLKEPNRTSNESNKTSSKNNNDAVFVAFTLENVSKDAEATLSESKPDWRWQLTASGRFAHRKEYVIATGQRHGLTLVHYETLDNFRYEQGQGVRGHLFVMTKTVATTTNNQSTAKTYSNSKNEAINSARTNEL